MGDSLEYTSLTSRPTVCELKRKNEYETNIQDPLQEL